MLVVLSICTMVEIPVDLYMVIVDPFNSNPLPATWDDLFLNCSSSRIDFMTSLIFDRLLKLYSRKFEVCTWKLIYLHFSLQGWELAGFFYSKVPGEETRSHE